ncbi:DNA-processing protein DprA [Demequina sp. NBRC 110053]|uniref:DNA-processing protein DprA n=1 Tax=Demequina sp. NBRC 110053 TaxID=1570342 RepID=UPI001186C9B0|nr:DNA-processing protein DprA [Demequina sp. NBRC 110053]
MTDDLTSRIARASASDADACVAWSAVAEPADQAAGWLVAQLGPAEALRWVAIARANPVRASMELAPYGAGADVDHVVRASERWALRCSDLDVKELRERASRCGARIVVRGSGEWPGAVGDLGWTAPFALWARGEGDLRALGEGIAVVGARSSTAYGDHVAATMAGDLVRAGRTVVSGGAYGIDAAAHRGALGAGGATVAVMAGGVDRPYPAGNVDMLTRVMRDGVLVSEVPPGWAPHRSRFLTRNRLIACAAATVVVEAAHRSGALSTATHAQRLVRPVAAVPGPVTSAGSAGANRLIRDGEAVLVTGCAELLELVSPLDPSMGATPVGVAGVDFAAPEDRAVYDALGTRRAIEVDVARTAGLTHAQVRASLGRMEAGGLIERDVGGWRRRRQGAAASGARASKSDKTGQSGGET